MSDHPEFITLQVDFPLDNVIEALGNSLDYEQLVELINGLDEGVSDWDLTWPLCQHFEKLTEDYHREKMMTNGEGPSFYVASKVRHFQMWLEFIRRDNNVISSWVKKMDGIDLSGGVEERTQEEWVQISKECMEEAASCDVLVFYAENGEMWQGAFMEVGAALGAGRRVHVVGKDNPYLGEILFPHPNVYKFESVQEAFSEGWEYMKRKYPTRK